MQTVQTFIFILYLLGCFAVFCYKYKETKRCTLKAKACITVVNGDICYSAHDMNGKHIFTSNNYRPLWRRPEHMELWINPDDPIEFVYTKQSHWLFALKCLIGFALLYMFFNYM